MSGTKRSGMRSVLLGATSVALVAGCDTAVGVGLDAEIAVALAVPGSGGLFGGGAPNEIRSGGHVVVLSQATLTANRLVLDGAGRAEHNAEVTVDLPVQGGSVTPWRLRVASGSYDEVEVHVRRLRLRGTYDGEPFDVTARTDAAAELRLFPPVRVESGAASGVTVRVDLRDWLRGEAGALIEPARLTADTTLRALLRARVESSLSASAGS